MAGKLYGVGVGPGDPELLTLKALRVIGASDVIAVPGRRPRETVAYRIAAEACKDMGQKELLGIHMPMTKDEDELEKSHEEGIKLLREQLDQGKSVAFLTLGDPTVYSTYIYLHHRAAELGYETEIVSGVPSFCAAAARLNTEIAKKAEQIHIVPASYQVQEALELPGTKILMKAGKQLPKVKKALSAGQDTVVMVENCGMESERVYEGIGQIPDEAGYYTLLFVKGEGGAR